MTIGEHINLLRKRKKLSQAALGKLIGTSGDIIGRYERNFMTPSIDVIIKIAHELDVSIDFLVGKTNEELNKDMIQRLVEVTRLPQSKQDYVISLVDMCLRDFRASGVYAS